MPARRRPAAVSPRRDGRQVPASRGSRHSSVGSDRQSVSPPRRQPTAESLQENRRRLTSSGTKRKLSPKSGKRTRSSSSSGDEEQQKTSEKDDNRKLSKQNSRADAEQQAEAASRERLQHRQSRHADKRRRMTPDRRGNMSPERGLRSSPGRQSRVTSERQRRTSAEKYRRAGRSPDEHKQQVQARSPKPPARDQDTGGRKHKSDRMDSRRASSPMHSGSRRVRKGSSSSPERMKATSPAAKDQRPALDNVKVAQSDTAAAGHRRSQSESDDADLKQRKELSGNEEVLSVGCLILFIELL